MNITPIMYDIPLGMYIHYPWCEKKCPYCDFNSYDVSKTQSAYIDALITDSINQARDNTRPIRSIYIGGGTPSLMPLRDLERLFTTLHNHYQISLDAEITIEVNPSSASEHKFATYRELGINRISLGVQSFNDTSLRFLGRVHSSTQAQDALTLASEMFPECNGDIIFGLKNQTIEQVISDVETVLSYVPTHLSFYQLTIEPHTYFAKYPPILPDDEELYQMMNAGIERIEYAGLYRYEVSAYGNPSKHNMNYWQFGDYLGIGAGAHGKFTTHSDIVRTVMPANPKDYITHPHPQVQSIENRAFDFMLNALRLKSGVTYELFTQRTGLSMSTIEPMLNQALDKKLIKNDSTMIIPTELGYNHLNTLQEIFL